MAISSDIIGVKVVYGDKSLTKTVNEKKNSSQSVGNNKCIFETNHNMILFGPRECNFFGNSHQVHSKTTT